eukprot:5626066-Lingulodinium_polyedra.AAC.1
MFKVVGLGEVDAWVVDTLSLVDKLDLTVKGTGSLVKANPVLAVDKVDKLKDQGLKFYHCK